MTEDDLQMFAVVVASAAARATYRRVMAHVHKVSLHGAIDVAEVESVLIDPNAFDVFDDPAVTERIQELLKKDDPT